MTDPKAQGARPQVTLDASQSLDLVAVASRAQSEKLREVLNRIDQLTAIDRERIRNITDVLEAASGNGGCGIGCW